MAFIMMETTRTMMRGPHIMMETSHIMMHTTPIMMRKARTMMQRAAIRMKPANRWNAPTPPRVEDSHGATQTRRVRPPADSNLGLSSPSAKIGLHPPPSSGTVQIPLHQRSPGESA